MTDGIVVIVPLVDAVKTTSNQIERGGVDVSLQCMITEKLNGCFKVRLIDANEKGANFALVDGKGEIVGTSAMTPVDQNPQHRTVIRV